MGATSVSLSDSKCLLIWLDYDYDNKNHYSEWFTSNVSNQREGYPLSGKTLKAIMQYFKIQVQGIEDDCLYRMPLNPALPFLLCLKLFAYKVNPNNPQVVWNRCPSSDNVTIYRVAIACEKIDWGLRNRYYQRNGRGQDICEPLDKLLMQWKIQIKTSSDTKSPKDEWRILFTEGLKFPPYGLDFTPGWVHLFWTASPS